MPSSAGKGWGRHWGAFKLLYYHCNTSKIDKVEQPRTVCGAEECRVVMPQDATAAEEGAEEEDLEEDPEPRTAPSRHEVDQDAPATHQEKVLMEHISFQIKRTRDHNERIVFKYLSVE